ncbi:MAG: exo-alpha-sialidase [Chloroflexi bacterium]|nr:MAG: exo-alpha-sialidase [Chloroflexota bacterium]
MAPSSRPLSQVSPYTVTMNAATDTGQDHDPCLVTDGLGTWVAAWDSTDSLGGTIGADKDILVARSTDDGATWSAPAALNTNAATDGFALEDAVSLATDGTGTWVATWQSTDPLGGTIGTDWDILVARSTDNGAEWTSTEPLNVGIGPYEDSGPSLATDGAGNWVAVWHSNSDAHYSDTDFDILAEMTNQIPVELSGFALD